MAGGKKWRKKLGVSLLSTLVSLSVLEAVLHLTPDPLRRPDLRPFLEEDPILGWRHRPGSEGLIEGPDFSVELAYDEQGRRVDSFEEELDEDAPTVLLLGDSFLDGYTVPWEEHLAVHLRDALKAERPVRIVSAGTVAYSTDQELMQLRSLGPELAPAVVVLFFYDNDVLGNGRARLRQGTKPRFRLENDELVLEAWQPLAPEPPATASLASVKRGLRAHCRLYQHLVVFWKSRPSWYRTAIELGLATPPGEPLVRCGGRELPAEYLFYLEDPPESVEEDWRITERLLEELAGSATELGARFLLFYVPPRARIEPERWQALCTIFDLPPSEWRVNRVQDRLTRTAERLGLPFVDPVEAFARETEPLYLPVDGHWNTRGHRAAARALAGPVAKLLAE